jgi:hypothetical protein
MGAADFYGADIILGVMAVCEPQEPDSLPGQ